MTRRAVAQPSQHPHAERGLDLYETPAVAVRALLQAEWLPHRIWEPACGPGSIVRELRAAGRHVFASDVKDYGGSQSLTSDFFTIREAPLGFETAITNPPYKHAAEFTLHALDLVPRVIMLLPLRFLEAGTGTTAAAKARAVLLDDGHLARVHVFKERLPMMHRDGWDGPVNTSSQSFAWMCWERSWKGPAQFHRISWKESAAPVREAAE